MYNSRDKSKPWLFIDPVLQKLYQAKGNDSTIEPSTGNSTEKNRDFQMREGNDRYPDVRNNGSDYLTQEDTYRRQGIPTNQTRWYTPEDRTMTPSREPQNTGSYGRRSGAGHSVLPNARIDYIPNDAYMTSPEAASLATEPDRNNLIDDLLSHRINPDRETGSEGWVNLPDIVGRETGREGWVNLPDIVGRERNAGDMMVRQIREGRETDPGYWGDLQIIDGKKRDPGYWGDRQIREGKKTDPKGLMNPPETDGRETDPGYWGVRQIREGRKTDTKGLMNRPDRDGRETRPGYWGDRSIKNGREAGTMNRPERDEKDRNIIYWLEQHTDNDYQTDNNLPLHPYDDSLYGREVLYEEANGSPEIVANGKWDGKPGAIIEYASKDSGEGSNSGGSEASAGKSGGGEKISGFGEGLSQFGKKLMNDLRYNWGVIKSWWNHEVKRQKILTNMKPEIEKLSRMSPEELQGQIDKTREQAEKIKSREIHSDEERGQRERDYEDQFWIIEEIKNIQKKLQDGRNPEEIQGEIESYLKEGGEGLRQMREALLENDTFKETEGWAKVGEVGASVVQQALPIAAGIVAPPLGVALGVANVSTLSAQSAAEAGMNLDRHEEKNGERISEGERAAYIAAHAGSELILEGLMQGRYLGNITAPMRRMLGNQLSKGLLKNLGARHEMNRVINKLTREGSKALAKGVAKDAAMEGATEAVTSVTQDVATMIYQNAEEFPELNKIIGNALQSGRDGALMGSFLGTMSRKGNSVMQNRRRKEAALVSTAKVAGLGDVEVIGKNRAGEYDVLTGSGSIESIPEESLGQVSQVLYDDLLKARREAKELKQGKPIDLVGPLAKPDMKNYPWLTKEHSPSPKRKQEIAEELGKKLGVKVKVYHNNYVPAEIKKIMGSNEVCKGFYGWKDDFVNIIMPNINSEADLQSILMHEAVGHMGVRRLLGQNENEFFMKAFYSMPAKERAIYFDKYKSPNLAASEYIARLAESGVEDPNFWKKISASARELVRKNLGIDLKLNNSDLKYILWKSKNRIKGSDSMREMREKSQRDQTMRKKLLNNRE